IRNEYEAALRREKLLASAYASESKLVSEQASKATQYNILKREADTNRQLYNAMRQKVREYGIASAMPASNTRVIDPAKPPGRPYKPDVVRNSGLGLLAGLLLGVVFVFIREHADRSLQLPGDAPLYLNLPELGAIPSARSDSTKRLDGKTEPAASNKSTLDSGEPGLPPKGSRGRNGKPSERVELV